MWCCLFRHGPDQAEEQPGQHSMDKTEGKRKYAFDEVGSKGRKMGNKALTRQGLMATGFARDGGVSKTTVGAVGGAG